MSSPAKEGRKVLPFPKPEWSPSALVKGLQRREPEAAAAFYDSYETRINRLVWRLMGKTGDGGLLSQAISAG